MQEIFIRFYLCSMLSSFTTTLPINGNDIAFEFHTMNVKRLQLFQVYVMHEGKKQRFHVQIDDNSEFYITDLSTCPPPYRDLAKVFSDAIYMHYGKQ